MFNLKRNHVHRIIIEGHHHKKYIHIRYTRTYDTTNSNLYCDFIVELILKISLKPDSLRIYFETFDINSKIQYKIRLKSTRPN